jgi:hypothetical protein
MKKLSILFSFIALQASFSLIEFTDAYSQELTTYKDTTYNFVLQYPLYWLRTEIPGYYFLVGERAGIELTVKTNFEVEVDTSGKDLKSFCDWYEHWIAGSQVFTDFKILSKKEFDFQRMKAIEYHCTANAGGFSAEWKAIMFEKDHRVFKLATTSSSAKYSSMHEITERIFDSFRFRK